MVERNSIETPNIHPNFNDQKQFRLNKISEIKGYFLVNIKQKELMIKIIEKYIASFGYFGKFLIVLSATSGSISIALFATAIGSPVGISNASFSHFRFLHELQKKLLKTTTNKKKNHNITVTLARSKLNSTESKTFEELINNEISREDFMTISKK